MLRQPPGPSRLKVDWERPLKPALWSFWRWALQGVSRDSSGPSSHQVILWWWWWFASVNHWHGVEEPFLLACLESDPVEGVSVRAEGRQALA